VIKPVTNLDASDWQRIAVLISTTVATVVILSLAKNLQRATILPVVWYYGSRINCIRPILALDYPELTFLRLNGVVNSSDKRYNARHVLARVLPAAKGLKTLALFRCWWFRRLPDNLQCKNLTSITLTEYRIDIEALIYLLYGCPVLTDFAIHQSITDVIPP